jgi:prepilin-type N-terminal cleavage/methylation domain-containing protein
MTTTAASIAPRNTAMSTSPRGASHGFTLVEVLVAGTIFLVSLAGVLTGMNYASRQFEHQRHMSTALAVSETTMEEILMLSQNDPELAPGVHTRAFNNYGVEEVSGKFNAFWTVTLDVPVVGVREVVLIVRWQSGLDTKEMKLRTVRP